jgi:S-adenosyl-L-methionine hydrolase (adenosine-forming)
LNSRLKRNSTSKVTNSKVIALITDFGLQDQYVSVMKGVILSINPAVQIIDITHEVSPQRIRQAGYLLWSAYKFFPKGTIFVGVVDPGVGSDRRLLGVKTKQYTFLAPDNGLLDFILNEEKLVEEIEFSEKSAKKYLPNNISSTFHGRDIFAYIGAHISKGVSLKDIGNSTDQNASAAPFVYSRTDSMHICILHIDRFGNIITNLYAKDFENISKEVQAISVGRNLVSRWIRFYREAPENTPCLLVGSSGLVEISVPNNNAAHLLAASLDVPLKVYWR